MTAFDEARRAIASCEGYTIHLLNLSLLDGSDALEIGLHWGISKPDIVLSFRRIYYMAVGRSPDDDVPLLDRIEATELVPDGGAWPDALNEKMNLVRSTHLPNLLWLRTEGPVRLEVVAAIVSFHQQVRNPNDSNG